MWLCWRRVGRASNEGALSWPGIASFYSAKGRVFGEREIKVIPFEDEVVTRMKKAVYWVKLKFLMKMEQFVG